MQLKSQCATVEAWLISTLCLFGVGIIARCYARAVYAVVVLLLIVGYFLPSCHCISDMDKDRGIVATDGL